MAEFVDTLAFMMFVAAHILAVVVVRRLGIHDLAGQSSAGRDKYVSPGFKPRNDGSVVPARHEPAQDAIAPHR